MPPLATAAVLALPAILDDTAPGVPGLLDRRVHADGGEEQEEWERLAAPEVRRLFQSAREIVRADLAGLRLRAGVAASRGRLSIPAGNESAWLSALAAARVSLADAHALEPQMLDGADDLASLDREKVRAYVLIEHLGWVQEVIVRALSG